MGGTYGWDIAVSTHSELTAPHICSETGQKLNMYKPQTVYVMANTVAALFMSV